MSTAHQYSLSQYTVRIKVRAINIFFAFSRFVIDHCSKANFVLKTDDDQSVDTFHLVKFLSTFVKEISTGDPFILCNVMRDNVPYR